MTTNGIHPLIDEMRIDQIRYERQCELEMEGFVLGVSRYQKNREKVNKDKDRDNTLLAPEQHLLQTYLNDLGKALNKSINLPQRRIKGYPRLAKQFLQGAHFPMDRLAYVVLRYALNIPADGNTVQTACIKLGHQIEKDFEYMMFQDKAAGYLSVVERNIKSAHMAHRHKVLSHAIKKVNIYDEDGNLIGTGIEPLKWDEQMSFAVGKILLECLTDSIPLFEVVTVDNYVRIRKGKWGFMNVAQILIRRTDMCKEWLEKHHETLSILSPVVYPFIIEPKPWEGVSGGGFWTQYKSLESKILKTRINKAIHRVKRHGVEKVNEALNAIQSTKFRINKPVLEIMRECAKTGLGGLPVPDKEYVEVSGFNPLADTCPFSDEEIKRMEQNGDDSFIKWKSDRSKAWDEWYRNVSKREALLWKLRIAKQFKDEPEIYFMWTLDFRGRMYAVQPFINPQMDDSGKALLEFAEGKPLNTEDALNFFLQHGANVFGMDKLSLEDRRKWVLDNKEDILASARNPMDHRFWTEAEKPFSFLAFAFEFAGYIESGINFMSHLPVQEDGTCSGLQHYSALLRDDIGGKVVNLCTGDKKEDVYGVVADVANQILDDHLINGTDEQKTFAKIWKGIGVDRSVCKRNAMTRTYGATKQGFADQLVHYLIKEGKFIDGSNMAKACAYLAGVNWEAIARVVVKASEGMDILQKIAHFMAKHQYDIQWTSAIGLRVTQDYRKTKVRRINTWWGGTRINPCVQELTDEKNPIGNRNGIAPNYIHSQDASHLMLTAIECKKQGVSAFSFIHDSFGCHAHDMRKMHDILRSTFVEMYSNDLLSEFIDDARGQLYPEHVQEFDEIVAANKPDMGNLDIKEVCRSPYFFS